MSKAPKLTMSSVSFYEDNDLGIHGYTTAAGESLIGVTSLMKKHNLGDSSSDYSKIPQSVLNEAARKGNELHRLLENYDNGLAVDACKELQAYMSLNLDVLASEYLVSDNEIVASKIDKVLKDNTLADVKRTSKVYYRSLQWQLSIYAYLYEQQNPKRKVPRLICLHYVTRKNEFEVIDIERLPNDMIEALLKCEREGTIYEDNYNKTPAKFAGSDLPAFRESVGNFIKLRQLLDIAEEKLNNDYKQQLIEYFEGDGGNSIDLGFATISYVKPSVVNAFDSTKFKKEHPNTYSRYIKKTIRQSTIRITNGK